MRDTETAEQPGEPKGTPAAQWRADGETDPHGTRYDCERAALAMGHLTDDELANGAFLNYDRFDMARLVARDPDYHPPIAWMTAVKDRIRWLSRSLEAARATLSAAPAGQLPSYHPDSLLAKQVKLGYRWRGKACPCGDCQSPECQAAGCAWENDPSLVPVKERIPLAPAPIQPQPSDELIAQKWDESFKHCGGNVYLRAQWLVRALSGAAPTGAVQQPHPVAWEFLHPNGHAIVDYSEHTHVGHLSAEKGYIKRPLVYGDKR